MTLPEAIRYLLEEFKLEACVDIVRDDAKQDEGFDGLSSEHPTVRRFTEACATLRASLNVVDTCDGDHAAPRCGDPECWQQ